MKIRLRLYIAILAIFMVFAPAFAAGDYTNVKLNNGQTLIIKQVPQNPIVTIDTWINTGSINESDKNSGVAHFLEHLFFKGTTKYAPGEFEKILESKGAMTNAATSKDYTHYYITIPSKDFDLALSLHADMLLNPLIPRRELEKERLVVLEEISKNQDSPQNVMHNNLFKMLYQQEKHPYFRPVIGNSKVIESITRDEILDFYKAYYTPDNFYTVIVGDVVPADVMKKVETEFKTNEKTEAKAEIPKYPKLLPVSKPLKIVENKDVKNTYMVMAFRTQKFGDDKDAYALDVLSAILGEGKSSRLNQVLKEERQLVNSISSSSSLLKQDGLFGIQANFEPKNYDKVEKAIYEQINLIKKGNITDEDLAKAKNMIETSTYYSRESITNISNELGYSALFSGSTNYYDSYLSNIKKVTKAEVIKVAKKYLLPERVIISVVTPNNFEVSHTVIKSVERKNTEAKVIEKNNKATKYLLGNGAQLIVEKNPNNSIIAIEIANKGGNQIEKTPATLALAAMLAKEGTKNYTSKELSQILDEKGIDLTLNAGNDSFTITMQTTKNELQGALGLLSEIINYPAFPNYELEKIKKLKLASLKNLEDNPLMYSLDNFKALAFEGSIYGNNSEVYKKTIPIITKEEIESTYRQTLQPQNLVIAVVGNVDEAKIVNEFSTMFQIENIEGKKIDIKDLKIKTFEPVKNVEKTITKKDAKTAWLLLGYKTTNIFNEKDIVTLKIINAIMGEGMSSRLFRNLRDNEGLAYQIGTTNLQGALDGVFLAYIGTNERNLENAKRGILKEFNILKTEFVPQAELNRAKDKVLGNLIISLETNMDNAQLQSYNGVVDRDINYIEKYKKMIESVTQSDILSAANKYFSKPYIMTVLRN